MNRPQTILMCPPDYYGVDYVINAWMENQVGKVNHALAVRQWQNLRDALTPHVDLVLIEPQRNVPDMVFTANAGLVLRDQVIISRFNKAERRPEEPYFLDWFKQNNFNTYAWPQDLPFEGAGDALFDRGQPLTWVGHGFRSDSRAARLLEQFSGRRSIDLLMVNPHFYHLDTCLCPLKGGWLMYYPTAFDAASRQKIKEAIPADKLIAVSDKDAEGFACNAVEINGHIFTNYATTDLQDRLRCLGFTPIITPLGEYLKAGGGAKCLTLKLVEL